MRARIPISEAIATMATSVLASPARNMPEQLRETGGLGGSCPWFLFSSWGSMGGPRSGGDKGEAAEVSAPQVILKSYYAHRVPATE